MATQVNHFDRSKPFYPLVMNYLVQLLGYKELAIRGFLGKRTISSDDIQRITPNFDNVEKSEIDSTLDKLQKLIGPLELKSEFQNDRIVIDPDEIAKELLEGNHEYFLSFYVRASFNIIVLAHEITKNTTYRDVGPLWEFLRHCRNAATHNGLFHFGRGEPSRLAEWGRFRIDSQLLGTPLFKGPNGQGLLSIGDPIRLLWDIEQAYPQMHC